MREHLARAIHRDPAPAHLCEGVDPMGRGRAKAKQTKVARDLKYRTYETDFSELQRELHGDNGARANSSVDDAAEDYLDDVGSHAPNGADPNADDSESAQRS